MIFNYCFLLLLSFRGRCSIKYLVQTPFRRSLTLTIIFTIIILSLVAILLEILVVYPKQTLQSTKNATAVTVESKFIL